MVKPFLIAGLLALCGLGAASAVAQEQRPRSVARPAPGGRPAERVPDPDEVVRIRTRVVFLDALVKDRRTNEPVRDLAPSDFRVLDEGRPRELSYFTREGDSRRPLALLLFVDLWSMYGRAHLKSAAAMGRLAAALSRFIADLAARYSLGFSLAEGEADDGRLHRLSVKVAARDGKGRERRLLVRARRGYYMSEVRPPAPAPGP